MHLCGKQLCGGRRSLTCGTRALRPQSLVEDVNFETASVNIKDQGWKHHDVLIGADGIKSSIRTKMMARRGEVDETIDTGEAAYRECLLVSHSSLYVLLIFCSSYPAGVILSREQMEKDPELKQLIDDPVAIRWMGPTAHIVSYPIKSHTAYNIVTTHLTNAELDEDWTAKASKAVMVERFSDYAPIVCKVSRTASIYDYFLPLLTPQHCHSSSNLPPVMSSSSGSFASTFL